MSTPELLKRLRTEAKLSETAAANVMGVTRRTYQQYEKGTWEPSFKAVCQLIAHGTYQVQLVKEENILSI